MRVQNGACIRHLAQRSLRQSGRRNRIAVLAIALTALLFTAVFTGALSIYESDRAFRENMNWVSVSESVLSKATLETLLGVLALLAVIFAASYLIIYNIFQISVSGDIRYYGLLKTIGVTYRQLKRIIRDQGLVLWLAGTPVGLLLGYGTGALISPHIVRSVSDKITDAKISVSPAIFLLAAAFTLLTVMISVSRPAKMASKVSPVEAVRYTEEADLPPGRRKPVSRHRNSRRGGVRAMAFAYISGKKGRTAAVLVSLSLSVVLLNTLYILVSGFDDEKYLNDSCCADFVVGGSGYFQSDAGSAKSLPADVMSQLQNLSGMKDSGSAYILNQDVQAFSWMSREKMQEIYDSFGSAVDELDEALSHSPQKDSLVGNGTLIEALDPYLFRKLSVVKGDLASVEQAGSRNIAVVMESDGGVPLDPDDDSLPKLGDTIEVTYARYTGDGDVPYDIDGGNTVSYTVSAYVTIPDQIGLRLQEAAWKLIMPSDTLREDSGDEMTQLFYLMDSDSQKDKSSMEQLLSDMARKDASISFQSRTSIMAQFDGVRDMVGYVGGLLITVIVVIGVLNFISVVLTGIHTRSRQFAILQAVGMTNRQLLTMLITEGLFYAGGAILIAAAFSLVFYPLIAGAMSSLLWFLTPHLSLVPTLIAAALYLLMGRLVPRAACRSMMKESIVDRIREIG